MQRAIYPPATSPTTESALRGATLAFKASPLPSNADGLVSQAPYGALAAASRAGTGNYKPPSVPEKKIDRRTTNDVSLTAGRAALKRSPSQASSIGAPITRESSPSFIAATRAASRSRVPIAPHANINAGILLQPKLSPSESFLGDVGTDETPIPPTNRLVELFEAKQREPLPSKTLDKEMEATQNAAILSPKPIRPSLSVRLRGPITSKEAVPDPLKVDSPPKSAAKSPGQLSEQPDAMFPQPVQPRTLDEEFKIPPPAPNSRGATRPRSLHVLPKPVLLKSKSAEDIKTTPMASPAAKIPPALPPPRNRRSPSTRPQSTNPSALIRQTSTPPILPRRITHIPPGKLKPQLTADSLANAMVASSLASSRAPSPTQSSRPDPYMRPQSSKPSTMASLFLFHSPSHSPSPAKIPPLRQTGLRQTLRKEPSSTEDDELPKRGHHHKPGFLVKKHPHKHAEGARNRWRDSITERERKRYEGVWAANRGTLLQHELLHDPNADITADVHGYVVRDIWSRSGLGVRVLSEVWELVESGGRASRERSGSSDRRRGRLTRYEFVVGLWLVDQCLKGRKLPFEVQESVWSSARGLMSGLRTR